MPAAKKDTKQFVWFDSYTQAALAIPDEDLRNRFIAAIVLYGATGQEPQFDADLWALTAAFEAVRPNVENSRKSYENSTKPPKPGKGKRGRPRKKAEPAILDDVEAYADTTCVPDYVIDNMAATAEMEAEVW